MRTVDWVWVGKCQLTYVLGQKAVHRISRDNNKHRQHIKDLPYAALEAIFKQLKGNLPVPQNLADEVLDLILL